MSHVTAAHHEVTTFSHAQFNALRRRSSTSRYFALPGIDLLINCRVSDAFCARFRAQSFCACSLRACGAGARSSFCGMARWAVTAAAAAAAVGGASVQNIALVWWTSGSSAGVYNGTAAGGGTDAAAGGTSRGTSPFAVLFIGCLYFLLTFLVLIGARAVAAGGDWAMFMPSHDPVRGRARRLRRAGGFLLRPRLHHSFFSFTPATPRAGAKRAVRVLLRRA